MSKPHSPSSSPTTPSPPSSSAPKPNQRGCEDIPPQSGAATGLRDEPLSSRPIRTIDTTPSSERRPLRLEESNPSDSRRAKRLRTESSENPEPRSSKFDSNPVIASTSSLTRNMGAQSEQPTSTPIIVAPKKKRTRTLTTPHQAAVLYALLAQSRFPTTAMREEVGRSIGLSARKVQIWFQNQRQKARRPRSQTETNNSTMQPLNALPSFPQYTSAPGPSSIRPETNPSLLPPPTPSSSSYQLQPTSASESYSHLSDPPSQLLGPGVPGLDPHLVNVSRGGSLMPHTSSRIDFDHPVAGPSRASSQVSPTQRQRLGTTLIFPSHYQNPYRTLPPLTSDSQIGARDPVSRLGSQQAINQLPSSDCAGYPLPLELPFIHYRPTSNQPTTGHVVGSGSIPPPFTLQPQPQWDERSFTPSLARPGMWSTPGPSGSTPSTQAAFVPSAGTALTGFPRHGLRHSAPARTPGTPQPEFTPSPPQQRMGRYDPVRATIVPLPKESSPQPSTPSPSRD